MPQRFDRGDGNVLELVGNDVTVRRELFQRSGIVISAADDFTTGGCGRVVRRIDKAALDAERLPGKAEHLAELAGANDTDTHYLRGSLSARTDCVCLLR